jgi:hypothetical protein
MRKKTISAKVAALSATSIIFLVGVLLASSIVSTARNVQGATNTTATNSNNNSGIADNKYLKYVNHVHGGYRFLERHTWHYNSTKSETDNLNAFQAWWCTDDSGKAIAADKCTDMPKGDVKAFMQFVEKSRDKLLFDKVVQLQDEMGEHHSIKQWFIQAYNNNGNPLPSPSATTDHTDSEMKAMMQASANKL